MKRQFFGLMIITMITVATFTACTVTGTLNEDTILPPDPTIPQMTFVSNKSDVLTFELGGSGTITINWGDGTPIEMFTILNNTNYTHRYSDTNPHTITITGENIIRMNFPDTKVSSMDISENVALTYLNCSNNQLKTLDVSKNIALTELYCSYNQLMDLNVKSNTALVRLDCSANQLTELDVSKNNALNILVCNNNELVDFLNTESNAQLFFLNCGKNRLEKLSMSHNLALAVLNCENNLMDAESLSEMLLTLHSNDIDIPGIDKVVNIKKNIGTETCENKDVARSNGWDVID